MILRKTDFHRTLLAQSFLSFWWTAVLRYAARVGICVNNRNRERIIFNSSKLNLKKLCFKSLKNVKDTWTSNMKFILWAKIYLYGPQFLGQSTTPVLHRFLRQKRSRLSFRLYFCGPAFYTCLSNKYNILWSRVLHLCISRTIWLVFRGLHTFSNGTNISHRLGDGKTQGCGPGLG